MNYKELIMNACPEGLALIGTATTGVNPKVHELIAVHVIPVGTGKPEETLYRIMSGLHLSEGRAYHKVPDSAMAYFGLLDEDFITRLCDLTCDIPVFTYNPRFQKEFISKYSIMNPFDLAVIYKGASARAALSTKDTGSMSNFYRKMMAVTEGRAPGFKALCEQLHIPNEVPGLLPLQASTRALLQIFDRLGQIEVTLSD